MNYPFVFSWDVRKDFFIYQKAQSHIWEQMREMCDKYNNLLNSKMFIFNDDAQIPSHLLNKVTEFRDSFNYTYGV